MTAPDVPDGSDEPLLLPIGHYLGALHDQPEPGRRVHRVRRGVEFLSLSDGEFLAWSLGTGAPERIAEGVRWTRRAAADYADSVGVGERPDVDVEATTEALLGSGMLVELRPDGDDAVEFASRHVLTPLMIGLGNTADAVDAYRIGFLAQPLIAVPFPVYDVWQWSPMDTSLWATCERSARTAQRSGFDDPVFTDPAALLAVVLTDVHVLLSSGAAALNRDVRLAAVPPR